jgi:hypothetical protein
LHRPYWNDFRSGEIRRINDQMRGAQRSNNNVRRSQALAHYQLGTAHKLLASQATAGSPRSLDNWRQARGHFQESIELYQELKSKNALVGSDFEKLDELAAKIAECDAAIRTRHRIRRRGLVVSS